MLANVIFNFNLAIIEFKFNLGLKINTMRA
jgi:hypothetical protein